MKRSTQNSVTSRIGFEETNIAYQAMTSELERLQRLSKTGYEVTVEWHPGEAKYKDEKRLAEEVVGNTVNVYCEDPQEALRLVQHGFIEWLLNHYTKPYRQLTNALIRLFEEQQYERKERAIEALLNLL